MPFFDDLQKQRIDCKSLTAFGLGVLADCCQAFHGPLNSSASSPRVGFAQSACGHGLTSFNARDSWVNERCRNLTDRAQGVPGRERLRDFSSTPSDCLFGELDWFVQLGSLMSLTGPKTISPRSHASRKLGKLGSMSSATRISWRRSQ